MCLFSVCTQVFNIFDVLIIHRLSSLSSLLLLLLKWLLLFVQNSMSDMTFDTSNASMVSGLVDYMSTLVSGDGTKDSDRRLSDNPPPLPPKVSNAKQPVQPVCSLWFESVLFLSRHSTVVRAVDWYSRSCQCESCSPLCRSKCYCRVRRWLTTL